MASTRTLSARGLRRITVKLPSAGAAEPGCAVVYRRPLSRQVLPNKVRQWDDVSRELQHDILERV